MYMCYRCVGRGAAGDCEGCAVTVAVGAGGRAVTVLAGAEAGVFATSGVDTIRTIFVSLVAVCPGLGITCVT